MEYTNLVVDPVQHRDRNACGERNGVRASEFRIEQGLRASSYPLLEAYLFLFAGMPAGPNRAPQLSTKRLREGPNIFRLYL